jgi:hypothetical protein
LLDVNKNYVPDTKVGYASYLLDLRKRKILDEIIKNRKAADTVKIIPKELDSIKNQFQKIEAPQKSRFEFGLYGGGTIFTGTISNGNIFNNEMNMLFGLNVNYTLYSNLSASLYVSSSKLSNSDYNASSNDQIARGMSFSTSILSISPSINYDYIDNRLGIFFGRPNNWGQRFSNVLLQQADLVVALGARLGLQQTGFNWKEFAPKAKGVTPFHFGFRCRKLAALFSTPAGPSA